MATFGSAVRRGLPRVPGGEPWPPAGDARVTDDTGEAPVPNGDGGAPVGAETAVTGRVVAVAIRRPLALAAKTGVATRTPLISSGTVQS